MMPRRKLTVDWKKLDRYGRVVGKVLQQGQDMNRVQVKRGMAWIYVAYPKEQTPTDGVAYADAERMARTQRLGL
ncbi:thermonuclease family protein [Variovorax humicola]|uniref:Thermonuclease family protein n=1 Tax=Variovorax humicola TaxID=1769758 RepID=A0ABU8VUQ6_9BURK